MQVCKARCSQPIGAESDAPSQLINWAHLPPRGQRRCACSPGGAPTCRAGRTGSRLYLFLHSSGANSRPSEANRLRTGCTAGRTGAVGVLACNVVATFRRGQHSRPSQDDTQQVAWPANSGGDPRPRDRAAARFNREVRTATHRCWPWTARRARCASAGCPARPADRKNKYVYFLYLELPTKTRSPAPPWSPPIGFS